MATRCLSLLRSTRPSLSPSSSSSFSLSLSLSSSRPFTTGDPQWRMHRADGGKSPRYVTAAEAVADVESGSQILVHSHASTPTELLLALCDRTQTDGLHSLTLSHILAGGPKPWLLEDKYKGKMRSNSFFLCPESRKACELGMADYTPIILSEVPRLYLNGIQRCDVAVISVSTPDAHGYCSLGVNVDNTAAPLQVAKKIIAVENAQLPRTFGDSQLHISQIDAIVKVDRPIYGSRLGSGDDMTDIERKIGQTIADNLVEDGATLQLGIGAIPDSTLAAMRNHKNLGVHSELISDGVVDLIECGAINNSHKTVEPGKAVTSFAFGSKKFYDFVDNNPMFQFRTCSFTNRHEVIKANSKMTAINSCLEIDLTGQVVAESIGTRFFSGFGGQIDFIFGAANGYDGKGKAVIAIPSRTLKGHSKIVPTLKTGAGVVTTRGNVNYIVTEYGIAQLFGKNMRQRAAALIQISHPDDRESLEKAAFERLRVMPSLD